MNSIRLRLLLALMAALILVAVVLGAVTYRSVLAETETLFDYQLRQMALSLRDQGEIAPDQANALADEQLDFVIQIWSADGRAIYASRPHPDLPARALLGLADVAAGGQVWRTFSVTTGARVIQVAQPRRIRQSLAADAALRSVTPLAVLAPLLALAVWWLVALTLKPLQRVAEDVKARDEQSLQPLPTQGMPDEVAPLVVALNALLHRLERSFGTQRAFVADAAHELRSPLTALKLQIHQLERADDAPTRAAAAAALTAGIDRAVRLVEQLLALARSEPGAPPVAATEVDLAEVVRGALAEVAPLAIARGTEIELHAVNAVPLRGDAAALAILVRNLADNAVRHAPPGSRIDVSVAHDDGHPLLVIDDSGPGIPAADRDRVFDRFYRRGEADAEGSGLGLAIVRGVADRHGAVVSLDDSPLGGLRARVLFRGS